MIGDILMHGQQNTNTISQQNIDPNLFINISQKFDQALFESNIKELQQKIGLKNIDHQSSTFQDLKRYLTTILQYPSTSLAEFHRDSNRLGDLDVQMQSTQLRKSVHHINQLLNQLENCPCCGLIKQQEQLKIWTNQFKEVAKVGISTFMLYKTMINLIYLLIMALVIFGVFAFASNIKTSNAWNQKDPEESFSSSIKISLGSKIYLAILNVNPDNDLLICQVWLGLAMIISFMLAYIYIEWIQVTQIKKVQILNKSAADFTILMSGVPLDFSKENIQYEFNKLISNKIALQDSNNELRKTNIVAKINVGVPKQNRNLNKVKQQQEKFKLILEKQNEYKQKIVSYILQLTQTNQFKTSVQIRNQTQNEFLEFRRNNNLENNPLFFSIFKIGRKLNKNGLNMFLNKIGKQFISKDQKVNTNNLPSKDNLGQNILTDAFITFQSKNAKQKLFKSIQHSAIDKFLKYLTLSIYKKTIPIQLNGQIYKVRIQQASQPEDIIWDNIGVKSFQLFCRKCFTFFITFLVLALSFVIIYGLSTLQYNHQQNRYISFIISLCISIFNFIILFTLRILTSFQLSLTRTDYQSSLATKTIIAQLINTIIIPILVNRFLKNQSFLYEKSGLTQDVFLLSLTNSFLSPILKIFDTYYIFIKYFRTWYNERPALKFYLSQKQFNRIYELNEFQNGIQYVYIITLYLFTCFFMSLQPIIIVFAMCGYIMNYWAQKYCLFHRCKRPVPGNRILYDTMVQFIYSGGLFYSLGSLSFINLIPNDVFQNKINATLVANLIAVGISALSLFIPFSFLYQWLFNSTDSQQEIADQIFSEDRIFLSSQYDRMNPATNSFAIKEYIEFVNKKKSEIKNQSKQQINKFMDILSRQGRNNYNQRIENSNPLFYINPSARLYQQMNQNSYQFSSANMISNLLSFEIKQDNQQKVSQPRIPSRLKLDPLDNEIHIKFSKKNQKLTNKLEIQPFNEQPPSLFNLAAPGIRQQINNSKQNNQ